MTPWYVYPLAYLVGILFNLNPSCGSGTMIWTSLLTPMRPVLSWFSLKKNTSASNIPCPKTTRAVSSTEFCQCKFDEGNIWMRLGGGGDYIATILPLL
jgi:hypothetical protein